MLHIFYFQIPSFDRLAGDMKGKLSILFFNMHNYQIQQLSSTFIMHSRYRF